MTPCLVNEVLARETGRHNLTPPLAPWNDVVPPRRDLPLTKRARLSHPVPFAMTLPRTISTVNVSAQFVACEASLHRHSDEERSRAGHGGNVINRRDDLAWLRVFKRGAAQPHA